MNPAVIQGLMKAMGVDPSAFRDQAMAIKETVEGADARLRQIEDAQVRIEAMQAHIMDGIAIIMGALKLASSEQVAEAIGGNSHRERPN